MKNRHTAYSFPKLATISPVKTGSLQWLPSLVLIMNSLGHGKEKQHVPAPLPLIGSQPSCYKHTFSTLKTSISLLRLYRTGRPNVSGKSNRWHVAATCHWYSVLRPRGFERRKVYWLNWQTWDGWSVRGSITFTNIECRPKYSVFADVTQ